MPESLIHVLRSAFLCNDYFFGAPPVPTVNWHDGDFIVWSYYGGRFFNLPYHRRVINQESINKEVFQISQDH